jgi:hypothetical protein
MEAIASCLTKREIAPQPDIMPLDDLREGRSVASRRAGAQIPASRPRPLNWKLRIRRGKRREGTTFLYPAIGVSLHSGTTLERQ